MSPSLAFTGVPAGAAGPTMTDGDAAQPHVSASGTAFSPSLRSAYMSPQPSLSAAVTHLPAAPQHPLAVPRGPDHAAPATPTDGEAVPQLPAAPPAHSTVQLPVPTARPQLVPTEDPPRATWSPRGTLQQLAGSGAERQPGNRLPTHGSGDVMNVARLPDALALAQKQDIGAGTGAGTGPPVPPVPMGTHPDPLGTEEADLEMRQESLGLPIGAQEYKRRDLKSPPRADPLAHARK